MIYLNQAGTSWPKPAVVRAAVQDTFDASPADWADHLAAQHLEVCRAFGVGDPQRLLLTPGATSALAVAIADHMWMPGDRIVLSSWEHHALHRPAQQLERQGVEVVVVPPGDGGPLALDALDGVLRAGRVRLVAMTAACNITGECLPIEDIVAMARRHGALSLIDAAQSAGWKELDVQSLDPDLLVVTGHKGVHAPWGIGALYVRRTVTMASPRATCDRPTGPPGEAAACAPLPGACDVGSLDRPALAGLVAALRWLQDPARRDRLTTAQRQAATLAEALRDLPGVRLVRPGPAASRLPTVAFTVAGHSPTSVQALLRQRSIHVGAGQLCAPLAHETLGTIPDGVVRCSFGPSNDDTHAESAALALREILQTR